MNLKNCINRMNWKKVKGQTPPIRYIRDKITKITHDFLYGAKWSKESRATDTVKQSAVRFSLDYGRSPHVRARARGQTTPLRYIRAKITKITQDFQIFTI